MPLSQNGTSTPPRGALGVVLEIGISMQIDYAGIAQTVKMYMSEIQYGGIMNMNVVEVRNKLADALNRVAYGNERIILERRGKGVAVLVSMEDLALLEHLEDEQDVRASRKAMKEKGSVPLADVKKRLGMK